MIVHPPLHAAYVYDMLSILVVKASRSATQINLDNVASLDGYLRSVVGADQHKAVTSSPEGQALFQANLRVFERIDLIKTRAATGDDATYIDEQNYARYQAKLALQRRFFPDCPFTEQKIGYDKEVA